MPETPIDILLIEDNPADARLIDVYLAEARFGPCTVHKADTLAAARECLLRKRPDIILLDPGLPDSPPDRTLAAIREFSARRNEEVPVVVLSGVEDHDAGLRAVRDGAQDYLVKGTLDPDRLARTIRYSLERDRTHRQLARAQRERLRAVQLQSQVLDALPAEVVVLDVWGNIIAVNGAWRACCIENLVAEIDFGMGRPYFEVALQSVPENPNTDASHSAEITRGLTDVLAGTIPLFTLEYPSSITKRTRWYRMIAAAMSTEDYQGAIVMHLDITSRVQAIQALRDSEARYRAVVEDQTDLICRYRADATITFVNDALCRTFERSRDQLLGRTLYDVAPSVSRAEISGFLRAISSPPYRGENREHTLRRASGESAHIQWTDRAVIFDEGRPVEFQAVGRDVTAQKNAEKALKEADERLRFAQKMEAVGLLASGVAHDFNNLLTAIRGYTSLARSDLSDKKAVAEALDQVEEASRQATGVASALLTFARKSPLTKTPVEVAPVVEVAARLFRRSLPPPVKLELDIAAANDCWVEADPTQLQQIIMNLALNARDSIKGQGHVRIVAAPFDDTSTSPPLKKVRIVVSDNGSGMEPHVLARIFEPFFTTKAREQGTGLGLAVIHGIVTEHGGSVDVASTVGVGSTFTVTFPCCPRPAGFVETKPSPASLTGAGRIALVVSDNQLIRGLLASMLSSFGYEVSQASSAAEARATAGTSNRLIDLIVSDARVSDAPGLEIIASLRSEDHAPRAILVAGRDSPDIPDHDDDESGRFPAPGVVLLYKPFQIADLQRAIAEARETPGRAS